MENAHVCKTAEWWKEAVVYQIYPRSFFDSNGDGIGDLNGIASKLDYIKSLGVDVIWLNPVYQSPNDDNGYDISDYYGIMSEFGTMADWDKLLDQIHRRGLKLIMDLVVNHSSDEHEWFVQSRSSRDSEYRDYYIWRDPVDGAEPNDWVSYFSGPAWDFDPQTRQYYLHLFTKKQPDLNWENQKVRDEVFKMMRWWLDKGIDGFRMDVINLISKVPGLPPVNPERDGKLYHAEKYFANGPRVHEFLKEMNRKALSGYDIMTVGECPDVTPDIALKYVAPEREELSMVFQFEHMTMDQSRENKWDSVPFELTAFKEIISRWQTEMHGKGWNSNFLMNHDQPRAVSRFGEEGEYRKASAKMLLTFLLTLEGTPYIYQGEEIGMVNAGFRDIGDYRDVETRNYYNEVKEAGGDLEQVLRSFGTISRDNSRTPMQWDDSDNAGFSKGTPWISVGHRYEDINVEKDLDSPDSIIRYLREAVGVRKEHKGLIYGDFELIFPDHGELFAYRRRWEEDSYLVILNFGREEINSENLWEDSGLPTGGGDLRESLDTVLGNYEDPSPEQFYVIRPFEARVYKFIS